MAPRVEKTEVFRKGRNFAIRTYFASSIMRKHYFLLWMKETAYFYHGIGAELFDCAVNFKFYLNIFIFFNINTNQISKIKGAIFELRSNHLFRDQQYKEVLEVKCQACNFTGICSNPPVLNGKLLF